MTGRERCAAIMDYRPYDRLPAWFFGTWDETARRWVSEGLRSCDTVAEETGMDEDWERGMWQCHGLVDNRPFPPGRDEVIEETPDHKVIRTAMGALLKVRTTGESIPQHLEEALKPTREAWRQFKKCLDPSDPLRRPADWQAKARELNKRERATCFLAGSLFGWPREWMGVEQWSYLAYDDPVLYEEIISTVADFFIEIHQPVLEVARFEFAYFFEDCCGRSGPLFSPDTYRRFYLPHYKRLIDFYRSRGVPHILIDSDGFVEPLIPCWMESGFDILFPIEIGTWGADPVAIRRRFGCDLRMLGGVDKHVIPLGESAIREHLLRLRPVVADGGFIPIPDHRIPPSCSLKQFRTYVQVFKEAFT
jgi:hypothetical protein